MRNPSETRSGLEPLTCSLRASGRMFLGCCTRLQNPHTYALFPSPDWCVAPYCAPGGVNITLVSAKMRHPRGGCLVMDVPSTPHRIAAEAAMTTDRGVLRRAPRGADAASAPLGSTARRSHSRGGCSPPIILGATRRTIDNPTTRKNIPNPKPRACP